MTRGQRELRAWFATTKTTKKGLGERLGVTGQAVSNWLRGAAPPHEDYWPMLLLITGIDGAAFLTAKQKRERDERLAERARLLTAAAGIPATGTEG